MVSAKKKKGEGLGSHYGVESLGEKWGCGEREERKGPGARTSRGKKKKRNRPDAERRSKNDEPRAAPQAVDFVKDHPRKPLVIDPERP